MSDGLGTAPVRAELPIDELRDMVQDAHLNFLLGAGASMPFIALLGDTENLLTAIEASAADDAAKRHARASVYAAFLAAVVAKNLDLRTPTGDAGALLSTYASFLQTLTRLLHRRRSSLLNKQINLFTTNVDIAIELAAETLQAQLNDGFTGRFSPRFSTSNFGSVLSRRSLQYDNLSEIPTFNLIKLHGSVSWRPAAPGTEIGFDAGLGLVLSACQSVATLGTLTTVTPKTTVDELLTAGQGAPADQEVEEFLSAYGQLAVINPTKEKFRQTVLNQNYYDLLRLFSNEMEKENVLLFVIGFSCRDEHIRELIVRSARANPTLQVIVFAHSDGSASEISEQFEGHPTTNGNIRIVTPPLAEPGKLSPHYDLATVTTTFFEPLVLPKPSLTNRLTEGTANRPRPLGSG